MTMEIPDDVLEAIIEFVRLQRVFAQNRTNEDQSQDR